MQKTCSSIPATIRFGLNDAARRAPLAGLLVVAGDLMFWDAPLGLSVQVFLLAVAGGVVLANPGVLISPHRWKALAAVSLGLAPGIEASGPLPVLFAVAGVIGMALVASDVLRQTVIETLADIARVASIGLTWAIRDLPAMRKEHLAAGRRGLRDWVLAGIGGVIFAVLFAEANPVLDAWADRIDVTGLVSFDHPERLLLWAFVGAFVWACLRVRARMPSTPRDPAAPQITADLMPIGLLIGGDAIFRALVVFNAVFAMQTVLDLIYLWGGVALPDGMTYAEYAHRGAYPLIVAALLAGAFTMLATRAGSGGEASPVIRVLSYVWLGQTVWLVISSILRLDLYVGVYALSMWRVAAFIWMALVAVGLILIVVRLALRRSNMWLVNSALLAGIATLYLTSFVNLPGIIARHNVAVSAEMSGGGRPLDRRYICRLGPQALPAILRFNVALDYRAVRCDRGLEDRFARQMTHWQNLTLRNLRLDRRLMEIPVVVPLDLGYRDRDNGANEEPWP